TALPGASAWIVPTTVPATGRVVPSLPQPASASTATAKAAVKAPRRIGRESTDSQRTRAAHPSAPRPMTSTGVSFTSSERAIAMIMASTVGGLGLIVAIHTSTVAETRKRTMLYADFV